MRKRRTLAPPVEAWPVLHPPPSAGAAGGTQVLLAVSHAKPLTQSSVVAHALRHAPNAGSQTYGEQSNGTTPLTSHLPPGAGQ